MNDKVARMEEAVKRFNFFVTPINKEEARQEIAQLLTEAMLSDEKLYLQLCAIASIK